MHRAGASHPEPPVNWRRVCDEADALHGGRRIGSARAIAGPDLGRLTLYYGFPSDADRAAFNERLGIFALARQGRAVDWKRCEDATARALSQTGSSEL